MSLLDRFRAWWRRRFGGDGAAAPADAAVEGAGGHECAVCGTGIADPSEPCPLCRSTDVVPAAAAGGADAEAGAGAGAKAGPASTPGAVGTQHVSAGDDASVDRLRELRADGELLEQYAERWTSVDGGFRVETSGGTQVVDTREEVVALLRAEDG